MKTKFPLLKMSSSMCSTSVAVFFTFAMMDVAFAVNKFQTFDNAATAAAEGWAGLNNTSNGDNYGFSNTNNAAGQSAGEAGGIIARIGFPTYYADLSISGTYMRSTALSASGKLNVTVISKSNSFNGVIFISHFNHVYASGTLAGAVGITIRENDPNSLRFNACIVPPSGTFMTGTNSNGSRDVIITGLPNSPRSWSYSWNPTGGPGGTGELTATIDGPGGGTSILDLPPSTPDFTLDAFGVATSVLDGETDQSRLVDLFIDDVTYSVAPGVTVPSSRPWTMPLLFVVIPVIAVVCLKCGAARQAV